jgi:hypothetical protein
VASIEAVRIGGATQLPTTYVVDESGSISLICRDRWAWWNEECTASVDFTHGYADLPRDVAAIGYELALQAMSRPGANAQDMGAGPYRITLLKLGIGLDTDQESRLRAAGVVRAGVA